VIQGTDTSCMTQPRYVGVPTFMRAPLAPDWGGVDVGLIGVPYDGGVTNRAGARHGPREIRNASSFTRLIHHVTRINPYALCRVADLGDVRLQHLLDHERALGEIGAFFSRVRESRIVPLTAGGDHSITLPILRGMASSGRQLGLIQIDAHTDTWDTFQDARYSHGSPFRRAVEEGLIDPRRTVQIGIRGAQNAPEGWDYSLASGMRVIFVEEFSELRVEGVIAEARRVVGDGPAYVSFDIDGIDPVFAPGTGTPEVGGITTMEAQRLIRGLRGLDLVGADVVEVSPPFDPSGGTALVAATMMYELLCLLCECRAARV
jgi:guanidinopropionase